MNELLQRRVQDFSRPPSFSAEPEHNNCLMTLHNHAAAPGAGGETTENSNQSNRVQLQICLYSVPCVCGLGTPAVAPFPRFPDPAAFAGTNPSIAADGYDAIPLWAQN